MLSSQSKITTLCSTGVKSFYNDTCRKYIVLTVQNHGEMFKE